VWSRELAPWEDWSVTAKAEQDKGDDGLGGVAREHDCALTVSFKPQARAQGKAIETSYYARRVAASGQHSFAKDGFTTVQISPDGPVGAVNLVGFQTLLVLQL
jgi:hypothetical protein